MKQAACPDGRILTVAVKFLQPRHESTKLRIGTDVLIDPCYSAGDVDRFVVDLGVVLPASGTHALKLVDGEREFPLTAPSRDSSGAVEGPLTRENHWYRVSDEKDGAAVTVVTPKAATVVRGIRSSVDGIVLLLDAAVTEGSLVLRNRGRTVAIEPIAEANGWTVTLAGLKSGAQLDPEYWDFAFKRNGEETAVVGDTGDLARYGSAVNVPMLVYRDASGTALYSKVYFTGDGRLAVRTGNWRESQVAR
ncbi:hypothetical protein LK09_02070 [Microbacterium mangrovi]|uniref:Uncharacterized protein n=1 Tax=Microbacterium mangrovi TaxID=1348253 RepID=A0A0B2A8M6_9MICO|nr:hypothetical protein LK09_02070 [Microbacterium mangrovi]